MLAGGLCLRSVFVDRRFPVDGRSRSPSRTGSYSYFLLLRRNGRRGWRSCAGSPRALGRLCPSSIGPDVLSLRLFPLVIGSFDQRGIFILGYEWELPR